MAATAADSSYAPGIYRDKNGNAQVIKATATQTVFGNVQVQSGGAIVVSTGAAFRRQITFATTAAISLASDGADSGTTFINQVVKTVFTLPNATNVGQGTSYRFSVATGSSGGSGYAMKVKPQTADTISGAVAGPTGGENLTLASGNKALGDNVEVMRDQAGNWHVIDFKGTWTLTDAT